MLPARFVSKRAGPLTARERDVAALVAQGLSNREIAAALFIGERTVETHVSNILSKFDLTSRKQITGGIVEEVRATPASK